MKRQMSRANVFLMVMVLGLVLSTALWFFLVWLHQMAHAGV